MSDCRSLEQAVRSPRLLQLLHNNNPVGVLAIAIDRKSQRINEQIRISPVRVIGQEGEVLGVIETIDALQRPAKSA